MLMKNGAIKGALIAVFANMISNYITFQSWQMENVIVGLIIGGLLGHIFLK